MADRTIRHRMLRAAALTVAILITSGVFLGLDVLRTRAARGELVVLHLGGDE